MIVVALGGVHRRCWTHVAHVLSLAAFGSTNYGDGGPVRWARKRRRRAGAAERVVYASVRVANAEGGLYHLSFGRNWSPRTRRPGALGSACGEEDKQRHKEDELMGQATEMRLEFVRFDSDSVVLAYC